MQKPSSAYRELGAKRYRETSGLYYEDFEVGDVFEHRPGRTITDVDNIWVTLLTLNVQPVHFDAAYAAKTGCVALTLSHPRLATTLALTVRTLMPVRSASVNVLSTNNFFHSVFAA